MPVYDRLIFEFGIIMSCTHLTQSDRNVYPICFKTVDNERKPGENRFTSYSSGIRVTNRQTNKVATHLPECPLFFSVNTPCFSVYPCISNAARDGSYLASDTLMSTGDWCLSLQALLSSSSPHLAAPACV